MKKIKNNIFRETLIVSLLLSLIACTNHDSASHSLQLRTLSEQNLIDILVGSCIQSTRNCDPKQSIADVQKALSEGKVFQLIEVENVPQDDMVIAVQGIGGGGPWQYVIDRTKEQGLEKINNITII